jgi:hypothetical protein
MIPGEVLVENVCGNVRALFESFDDLRDSVGVELKRGEELGEFNLEVTKTDLSGEFFAKKLSSVGVFDSKLGREFVNFGYGLSFSIIGGAICPNSSFFDCLGYLKTDMDLVVSELATRNGLSVVANSITVQTGLFSDFSLALSANAVLNLGAISSPWLDIKSKSVINEGRISGKTVSVCAERLTCRKDASVSGSILLDIKAGEEILCDSSSISGKQIRASSPRMNLRNGSHLKSGSTFNFFGREFRNDNSVVLAENKVTVFSNIFFNGGSLSSESVDITARLEHFLFGALSSCTEIEEYEFLGTDKRFGCIANTGTIRGDSLSLTSGKHILNIGVLEVKRMARLFSAQELVNEGYILQAGYSQKSFQKYFRNRRLSIKKAL